VEFDPTKRITFFCTPPQVGVLELEEFYFLKWGVVGKWLKWGVVEGLELEYMSWSCVVIFFAVLA
jgi:hypothetical protein